MARSGAVADREETDEIEGLDEDEQDENETSPGGDEDGEAGTEAEEPSRYYVVVTMPKEMKELFTAKAKEADLATSALAKKLLADYLNYTLPPEVLTRSARPQKYANADERKAAQKSRQRERNALMKELLLRHKAELAAEAAAKGGQNGTVTSEAE